MQITKTNFTIDNIPFGIFSVADGQKRVATILGNQIFDLYEIALLGHFDDLAIPKSVFQSDFLNDFMALGKGKTKEVRKRLQTILKNAENLPPSVRHAEEAVTLYLPIKIGDYTDFYSSEQHATNVGMMFRDPANALLPNWKHLPVAYHGRASSIFVSGTNFHRPKGQINATDATPPSFSATKRLDIELEMAMVIGKPTELGDCVQVDEAEDYVFGFLLFNDWSARDIQRWEYVPLGPFLAKNFFSSVSAWVVTLEALAPFRVAAEAQNPEVLPYLQAKNRQNFDIELEIFLIPNSEKGTATEGVKICHSNFKNMYWTVSQQIAHHTVNGCNLNVGDVMASGTISGKTQDSFGSLLELTWGGKNALDMPDGSKRTFLEDGDTIVIRGFAEKNGVRIDFGEVRNTVLPTKV